MYLVIIFTTCISISSVRNKVWFTVPKMNNSLQKYKNIRVGPGSQYVSLYILK